MIQIGSSHRLPWRQLSSVGVEMEAEAEEAARKAQTHPGPQRWLRLERKHYAASVLSGKAEEGGGKPDHRREPEPWHTQGSG